MYFKYESLVFNKLNIGDKIKVIGTIKEPSTSTIFNTFDYKKVRTQNQGLLIK